MKTSKQEKKIKELQTANGVMTELCREYVRFIARRCNLNCKSYNSKTEKNTAHYGFVPYGNLNYLIAKLSKIHSHLRKRLKRNPRFLDIGCGIGNIVLLADLVGYNASGLEYDPDIYAVAKQLHAPTCYTEFNSEIIQNDMRTFKKYNEYDVLYYYEPMISKLAMKEFSIKLAKEMKPGAYLICHGTSIGFRQSSEFRYIGNPADCRGLWRKKGKLK